MGGRNRAVECVCVVSRFERVPTQNSISSIERAPLESLTQLLVSPSSSVPGRPNELLFFSRFFKILTKFRHFEIFHLILYIPLNH